jgi:cytochrome c-type biogenesis protein
MVTRTTLAKASLVVLVALAMTLSACISGGLDTGEAAPDFSVTDVDGIEHQLSDYEGKVLVIEFFATWCTYCTDQIPTMEKVREEYSEDQVAILFVDSDDRESKDKVADYRVKYDLQWPVVHQGGDMGADYKVEALPSTVVVDREGKVQYFHEGTVKESKLLEAIDEAL